MELLCNIQNEFVLKVNVLVKDIDIINDLTKIIGHHTVPQESFEIVIEKAKEVLDDIIENVSETFVNKNLLNKHSEGGEQLK